MEGYIGEIRMFGGNFAPRAWQLCQGQLLSIAQNTALFSILGTTFGGNGQTTFGLPDFRGRVPTGNGAGPGLPNVDIGELGGLNQVTLTLANLPAHNHSVTGTVTWNANSGTDGQTDDPTNRRLMGASIFTGASADPATLAPMDVKLATGVVGSSQPVGIQQPYLGIEFIICVEGIYPSRN